MVKKGTSSILTYFTSLLFAIMLFGGCASIQTPQGGPRDTEPPKMLKMEPENLTTNFKAKKVVIEFDEYFKLQNEFKEFSVSPEMAKPPILKPKGKKLEISFPDTLEMNTTYTLNFGKSIADVNEGNAVKNFTYVFATGPQLDSLSIKGRIINSLTGEPELDALAFILPINRDTLFGKSRPSIYTLTDSSGNYSLNNLRKDTYRLYVIKEKGGDKVYQQATDEVGFLKDSILLTKNLDSMNMKIFKEDATDFRMLEKRLNNDGSITFAFNQKLRKPQVTVIDPKAIDASKKYRFNKNNDSLKVWLTDLSFDSTKIVISDEGKMLDTASFTRGKKETYARVLTATNNIEGRAINPNKPLRLTFNFPIDSVNINKITFLEDSVPKTDFTLLKDTSDFLSYTIKYPWRAKKSYDIKFGAGAFTAIFNAKNKEFNTVFELGSKDDYGTLKVKIVVPEKDKSYIVEIVDANKSIVNTIVVRQDTAVNFSNYKAGKYFIRVTYDTNKNGKWDTGNVKLRLQPEKIWNEPKELSIRANWERNEIITILKQ
ncbi:Ig-like domain-containing domain [Pedobacter frigoris]|uniref:SbsA Ig-like domain-containing protein n=1 Tax=Pedobacter frigoris TaxID=2571272 RepID=A0A4V5P0I9_9SPHI|nr:Ig-like domain-containing domain [Pedobacter frigoris]TKC04939.1 hypothetical protein FA047_14305 [Pedobacter frigoris]